MTLLIITFFAIIMCCFTGVKNLNKLYKVFNYVSGAWFIFIVVRIIFYGMATIR